MITNQINQDRVRNTIEERFPSLVGPITFELIRDPVIAPVSGISYERADLLQWLQDNDTEPGTNNPLNANQLIDNRALKDVIDKLVDIFGQIDINQQPNFDANNFPGTRCMITQTFLRNPAVATSGSSYERGAMQEWLRNSMMDPNSRGRLRSRNLIRNVTLINVLGELRNFVEEAFGVIIEVDEEEQDQQQEQQNQQQQQQQNQPQVNQNQQQPQQQNQPQVNQNQQQFDNNLQIANDWLEEDGDDDFLEQDGENENEQEVGQNQQGNGQQEFVGFNVNEPPNVVVPQELDDWLEEDNNVVQERQQGVVPNRVNQVQQQQPLIFRQPQQPQQQRRQQQPPQQHRQQQLLLQQQLNNELQQLIAQNVMRDVNGQQQNFQSLQNQFQQGIQPRINEIPHRLTRILAAMVRVSAYTEQQFRDNLQYCQTMIRHLNSFRDQCGYIRGHGRNQAERNFANLGYNTMQSELNYLNHRINWCTNNQQGQGNANNNPFLLEANYNNRLLQMQNRQRGPRVGQ